MPSNKLTPSYLFALLLIAKSTAVSANEMVAIANEIQVRAEKVSDTKPVKGYQAKRSVTATKTDTPLLNVPQSVTVITRDQMQDSAVQSIGDAIRYVPGITLSQGEGNRDAINFRGVGVTTGDFFLDGVRDDIETYRDLYNIDRVEVLKGPNGLIFGRGAAGGAINRVSKEAGWDPVREVQVSYGAYNQKRSSFDYGQAINDTAAFRINAVYENSDSYRNGVNIERYGFNPTVTLLPTERTKVTLGFEYFKDMRIGDRGVPSLKSGSDDLDNRPYKIRDYQTFYGSYRHSDNQTETYGLNALFEHDFNDQIKLRNRTRYADYDKYYENVYAAGSVHADGSFKIGAYDMSTQRRNFINQTDVIFKFDSLGISHELLLGTEFNKQLTDNLRSISQFNTYNSSAETLSSSFNLNIANTLSDRDFVFNKPLHHVKSNVNIFAFYLQDQIQFNPYLSAILGIRQDRFQNDMDRTDWSNSGASPFSSNRTEFLTSPRASLIFKPVPEMSIYAAYSLSYVPRAGDQLVSLTSKIDGLKPEKFTNREIGVKYDITPDLNVSLAAYILQREHVLANSPSNPAEAILVNGTETKGYELSLAGKVTNNWSVFGGYAYQDAEISEDQSSGTILKGTRVGQTPKNTLSLWNRYDFNEAWGAAFGVVSRSAMYALTPTTTASTILPGYTRYDAAVFWKPEKNTRVQLNIENLTNKDYALSAHNNNNILPGSPITARLNVIYNF
jgi:catecholate siderophore receptor